VANNTRDLLLSWWCFRGRRNANGIASERINVEAGKLIGCRQPLPQYGARETRHRIDALNGDLCHLGMKVDDADPRIVHQPFLFYGSRVNGVHDWRGLSVGIVVAREAPCTRSADVPNPPILLSHDGSQGCNQRESRHESDGESPLPFHLPLPPNSPLVIIARDLTASETSSGLHSVNWFERNIRVATRLVLPWDQRDGSVDLIRALDLRDHAD
jgi:hypothetical protein